MEDNAVLILHNEPGGCAAEHAESDAGVLDEAAHVAAALAELGVPFRVASVRALRDVGRTLAAAREACVINLVESLGTSAAEACLVPAVCAALGKACTGSGTPCLLMALDKFQTKCALRAAGVPVPGGVVIPPGCITARSLAATKPVIVKPVCADASEGIDAGSVVMQPDPDTLRERVLRIHDRFHQPALAERYLDGREFNVSVLEMDGGLTVLPPAEIDFTAFPAGKARIVDYRAKWREDSFEFANTPRRIPADIGVAAAERLRATAVAAWKCLGCRDYARIDMRMNSAGKPFVVEVNPNPDVSPGAGFAAALQAGGLGFADFVGILLKNAGVPFPRTQRPTNAERKEAGLQVRRTLAPDRDAILGMIGAAGVFRPYELDVAREVLDDALAAGEHGHYQSYTAVLDGRTAGWICFGPTPCTTGTFDLYWLAVHPACRARGVGTALLSRAETDIRARSGRLIVVETSSREDYEPARRLYERHGYTMAARLAGFYGEGDDKLVYLKDQTSQ